MCVFIVEKPSAKDSAAIQVLAALRELRLQCRFCLAGVQNVWQSDRDGLTNVD
jgi:hypothetical protein